MKYKNNETQLLNNKLIFEQKLKKPNLNKIPKSNIFPKNISNIPIPNNVYNKNTNKKSLLPSKPTSTYSLKRTNSNSSTNNYSGRNIPFINDKNIYSSIRNFKQMFNKNQNKKLNIYKRIYSSEKSRSEKNEESSYTSRRNLNIDHIYNLKIEYNLLKQNIQKLINKKVYPDEIDITNMEIEEKIQKLEKILDKINEEIRKNENKIEVKKVKVSTKEELNKKLLELYIEKYNNVNKKLKEITDKNYIETIENEIEQIDNEINFYEQENREILNDDNLNNNSSLNKKFNTLTLPNIKTTNKNKINIGVKNDHEFIIDKQLQNKITEYKNQISQQIQISKKIRDNEITLKRNEEIINNLLTEYNNLQQYYEKGKFDEEYYSNNTNKDNDIYNTNFPIISNIKDINSIYEENMKEKEKNKKKIKNELVLIEKKRISKINKINALEPLIDKNSKEILSLSKETRNRNITTDNNLKYENKHILCLPYPISKKKNLSCTNINSNINDNDSNSTTKNKNIKEIILKNLDLKEKEEKTLINIHENDTFSSNKYKHIKLKPNFSFNNDYNLFQDEKIKKIPKLQSSVENKNTIKVNLYNNDKEKEELINESIQMDESSNKIYENKSNVNNGNCNEKKIIRLMNIPEMNGKNNEYNIKKIKPNKSNKNKEEEKKNSHYSIVTEQREKVLNTIMYDDIVEQGSIL